MQRVKAGLYLGLLCACAILTACTAASPMATQTPKTIASEAKTLEATAVSTQTGTPTGIPGQAETPTLAVSYAPTAVLPTPSLPLSNKVGFPFSDFFFDNSGYPGCELPCWKGLTIGKSNSEQVQHMFDTEFGFKGTLDFRTVPTLTKADLETLGVGNLPETYIMGYGWFNRPTGLFQVAAALNQNTDLFDGLAFLWTVNQPSGFQVDMTPQDFLKRLGTPSQMWASVNISESATVGGLDLIMVYDQGIVLKWVSSVPMTLSNGSIKAKFCLGKSTPEAGTGLLGSIYIVEPFPNDPSHLSTFQQAVQANINRTIKIRGLVPFEDVFGITPDAATQLALKGGDNCIYSK
jgi:hypothetical protein